MSSSPAPKTTSAPAPASNSSSYARPGSSKNRRVPAGGPVSFLKAIVRGLRTKTALPDIPSPLSLKTVDEKTAFNARLKELGVDYCNLAVGVNESGKAELASVERHLGLIGQAGTGKSVAGAFLAYQFAALGGAVFVLDIACDRGLKTRLQSMLAGQDIAFRDTRASSEVDYITPGLTYWAPEGLSWKQTEDALDESFRAFNSAIKTKTESGPLPTPMMIYIAEAGTLISSIGAKAFASFLRDAQRMHLRVVYDLQSCIFPYKGTPDEMEGCDLLLTYTGGFALFKMRGAEREISRLSELARKPLRQEVAWLEVGQTLLVRPWEGSSPVQIRVPYLEV